MVCYGIFWSGQLNRDAIGRLSVNPWFTGYEEPLVVEVTSSLKNVD